MGPQVGFASAGIVLLAGRHLELPTEARCYLEKRYQVAEIMNGTAAWGWLQTNTPVLVIADLTDSRLNGYSLCHAIAHHPALASVSVLLISPDSPEAWFTALQEGADDCMEKPIDLRRFAARVRNLVARSRRIRECLTGYDWGPGPFDAQSAHGVKETYFIREGDVFLRKIEESIDTNLDNPQFNIRSLARSLAMGRASLYRQLRMIGNLSPGRIILERRLQHAALLFTNSQKTVTEVAYAVGFKSLSHFSRSFRKHHGMPPMVYLRDAGRRNNPPAA